MSVPIADLKTVIDILRAKEVLAKKKTFTLAVLGISTYAAENFLEDDQEFEVSAYIGEVEIIAALEYEHAKASGHPFAEGLGALPWKIIAGWLLKKILDEIFKRIDG